MTGPDPDIRISPASFNKSVQIGNDLIDSIYIDNIGNLPLYFGIHRTNNWLTIAPDTGSVPIASGDTLLVTFDGHRAAGIYNDTIRVNSNDPDQPLIIVPVLFRVTTGPGPNCQYFMGDVNNTGIFNGLDVTYSVAYFKGGALPPYSCECTVGNTWFVAGDVNASCNFNGVDVTYMVAYFKGGPTCHPCADCPPLPLDAPLIAPHHAVGMDNGQ